MRQKHKQLLGVLVVVLCAFLLFHQPIVAEVGNSGGFGGGSSGGGGSWGGSGGFFVFGGGPVAIIIFIIFIAIRLYASSKQSDRGTSSRSAFNTSYINEDAVIAKIKENDPNFSAEKFRGYVGEIYITLQEAWEAKDWKAVRPFESNALFNMHNRQLQEYIDKNWTNHLNMQDVRQVTLASYKIDGDQEVLSVRVNACCIDYTTDDNTGKVISGNERQLNERSYRFEFIRSVGVKTDVEVGLNPTNCPNCGAPTQVTSSGECEYCHSVITNGKYGWVLNKYGAW
ncbi:hypothetical protein M2475_000376 [Breznakia sp. PF5-3]|uniref:TIM44-like domain-containing protein n=1 Tax=unclassified Breznakia TaxID=2623764 RepID=UPI002405502B|nr:MULTISPECIES: TIM44-like domain-containing protein [unclassified Breznakia]MDF9824028.1 hypothetical protein [Breznakia sp. PM6-1]MDF9834827.1 hypothetical protein [Breznakia sp. PF5-3]MDF9838146.1 hypothetical protein [Breznakia sp. PFB2-8]MDF9860132.1 hypothetical protein [Breznakia sp. PH5-24]